MLPILTTPYVYHIGSLQASDRGERFASSLEGNALSVSNCPSAWASIARLGGKPLHKLAPSGGQAFRFLDGDAVMIPPFKDACLNWCQAAGLVKAEPQWRSWHEDEEGGWNYLFWNSEEEALDDVCGDQVMVDSLAAWVGTEKLAELMKCSSVTWGHSPEQAVQAWAQIRLAPQYGLHGVWWDGPYRPDMQSAPSGAVFPGVVPDLLAEEVSWGLVEEDRVDFELSPAQPEPGISSAEVPFP